MATIIGNYVSDLNARFLVVPWFGLLGALATWLFLPDTTGLDLKEQERRWAYIRSGREHEYHGVAIHPKHLSLWERWRGVGKNYNAEEDYKQRVEEMRADWEQAMEARASEKEAERRASFHDVFDDNWSSEVSTFFERTRSKQAGAAKSPFKEGAGGANSANGTSETLNEKEEFENGNH